MQIKTPNDPVAIQGYYKTATEQECLEQGRTMAKRLYDDMLKSVPAYTAFIEEYCSANSISDPSNVAFDIIPSVDKDNYLRSYSRSQLCWDGDMRHSAWVISSTSGSTGEPFYFPRQAQQDECYSLTAEVYLRENFRIHERSTLYIIAFPMGAWIGGVFTYEAIRQVAKRGYALSIITPGINKLEVIKAVKSLAADFDQVIIGSYAPFLSDILNDGELEGIDWGSINVGFIFSAEGFSEEFRDYVAKKAKLRNIYTDTLNHYGTVDLGTMAHETPLTILIRRLALKNPDCYAELFGSSKQATLCQYDPALFYFEAKDGNLFCSAYSGYPLFRYNLKDKGGLLTRIEINQVFSNYDIDLDQAIRDAGLAESIWNLPFVFVNERSDFSVSFYAFQIYPETLRNALLVDELRDAVTGKFSMQVVFDNDGRQLFEVHVEMRGPTNASDALVKNITRILHERLLAENSEYRKVSEECGYDRVYPRVTLWPYEDPTHFKPGGKQKWVKK